MKNGDFTIKNISFIIKNSDLTINNRDSTINELDLTKKGTHQKWRFGEAFQQELDGLGSGCWGYLANKQGLSENRLPQNLMVYLIILFLIKWPFGVIPHFQTHPYIMVPVSYGFVNHT